MNDEDKAVIRMAILHVLGAAEVPMNLVGLVTNVRLVFSGLTEDLDYVVEQLSLLIDEGIVIRHTRPEAGVVYNRYELNLMHKLAAL